MPFERSGDRALFRLTNAIAQASTDPIHRWSLVLWMHRDAVPQTLACHQLCLLAEDLHGHAMEICLLVGWVLTVNFSDFKDDLIDDKLFHLWMFPTRLVAVIVSEFVLTPEAIAFIITQAQAHYGITGRDFFEWDTRQIERNNQAVTIGHTHCKVIIYPNLEGPCPYKRDLYPMLVPHHWHDDDWLRGLARWSYDHGRMSCLGFCQLLVVVTAAICEVAVYVFRTYPPRWVQQRQWSQHVTFRATLWVQTRPERAQDGISASRYTYEVLLYATGKSKTWISCWKAQSADPCALGCGIISTAENSRNLGLIGSSNDKLHVPARPSSWPNGFKMH